MQTLEPTPKAAHERAGRFSPLSFSPLETTGGVNCVTFDVEDYFQVESLRPLVDFADWPIHELRVEANTRRLLALLSERDVRSTFFILGWIAERAPGIVREIHEAGHEVACHGYAHRMIGEQTPEEFRLDVSKAKRLIEDITGERILGYRAPTFSITEQTLWALDILAEEGFEYDSSVFPVRHDRYGIPDWSQGVDTVLLGGGKKIIEAPPATVRISGVNLPTGGGGYFRLAPLWVSARAIRRVNAEGRPAILYLHPWEIDPDQPRFPLPAKSGFRHYVNLSSTERKLRSLLSSFKFAPMKDALGL